MNIQSLKPGNLYYHNFVDSIRLYKERDIVSYFARLGFNKNFLLVELVGPINVFGDVFYDLKVLSEDKLGWFRLHRSKAIYIHEFKEEKDDDLGMTL